MSTTQTSGVVDENRPPRKERRFDNLQFAGLSNIPQNGTRYGRPFSTSSDTTQRGIKAPFDFCGSAPPPHRVTAYELALSVAAIE
jgi:hypothetical protein